MFFFRFHLKIKDKSASRNKTTSSLTPESWILCQTMSEESPEPEKDAELKTPLERDQKKARVNGEISKALDQSYKHVLLALRNFDASGQLALQAMTAATKASNSAAQAQALLEGSQKSL